MFAQRLLLAAAALSAAGCSYRFDNPAEQLGPGEVGGRTIASAALLEGVAVSVKGATWQSVGLDAVSRASGRFAVLPLPAGTHTLTFRQGKGRAAQRDVEIGFGADGRPNGVWLGDVELTASAGITGLVYPPDPVHHSIVDGVVFDEVTGAVAPLGWNGFTLEGLALGRHRLSLFAVDESGTPGVAGPFEVTLYQSDAGFVKALQDVTVHPLATAGSVKLRLKVTGDVPAFDLSTATVHGLPTGVIPSQSSSGLIQVDGLPEGYWTLGLTLPPGATPDLNDPPFVSFVAVAGAVIDLGSLYAVTGAAASPVQTVAPASIPWCDATSTGCTAGALYSSSGYPPSGTTTCVESSGAKAAVACGTQCTPDGVAVLTAAPGAGGCPAVP